MIEENSILQQAIAICIEFGFHFIKDLAEDDVIAKAGVHAAGINTCRIAYIAPGKGEIAATETTKATNDIVALVGEDQAVAETDALELLELIARSSGPISDGQALTCDCGVERWGAVDQRPIDTNGTAIERDAIGGPVQQAGSR